MQRQSVMTWTVENWIPHLVANDPKYTEVSLSNRNVDDEACADLCRALEANSYLKVLDLQANQITALGVQAIATMLRTNDAIKEINLEGNPVGDDGVQIIVDALKENNSLCALRVDNSISPVLAATLAFRLQLNTQPSAFKVMLHAMEAEDREGASTLDLNGVDHGALSMQFLAECLLRNKYITRVDASNTMLGDKGAETMGSLLRRSQTIKQILLNNDGVGVHGVRDLAEGLRDNKSITQLELRGNKIGDDAVRVLVDALKANDTLVSCDLQQNAVSQQALDVLNRALVLNAQPLPLKRALHRALSNDAALNEIDLSSVASMTQSALFLSPALRTNTNVKILNLSNACIGNDGANEISNMIKVNATLTTLHLSNNLISMAGGQVLANAMSGNMALTDVNVANNDILNEGALAFVRMLQINPNIIALNVELNDVSDEILQQIEWLLFINLQPKGLKRLLPNIQNNDTRLTQINFAAYDGERYHSDGSMLVLCRYLLHNYTVQELLFANNNIGDMGAVHVSEVLRDNRSITKVDFGTNGICDRGGVALAEALRVNTTVAFLNLEGNCCGEATAVAFIETLRENHAISYLNLKGNRVPAAVMSDLHLATAINTQPISLKTVIPRLRQKDATLKELDFSANTTKLFDDTSIAILCHEMRDNNSVVTLKLSNNCFEQDGARILGELLKANNILTVLEVGNNTIGDLGLQYLSEALKSNTSLRVMNVENNHIGDRGAEALIDALHNNDTLTDVYIAGNDIAKSLQDDLEAELSLNGQPLTLKRILPRLRANDPTLTIVDLSQGDAEKKYDDNSCHAITLAMRSNSTVTALNLADNAITSSGAIDLASMLEDNTSLRELSLAGNQIDDEGASAMVTVLSEHNHTLCLLDISGNRDLSPEIISQLQFAILFNNQPLALKQSIRSLAANDSTLTRLDFSAFDGRNKMTDVSVRLLCAMLVNNETVTDLILRDNEITDVGVANLAEVLRTNNSIRSLDISGNPGVTAISIKTLAQCLKSNHTLAVLRLDSKRIPTDLVEDIESHIRINSVPMSTQATYKRGGGVNKAAKTRAMPTYEELYADDTLVLHDALRVWRQ